MSYVYDNCTNGMGRLCIQSIAPANASPLVTSYNYTPFGDLADHQDVSYAYDAAGRLHSITYPSGAVVTYSYNLNGQVNQVDVIRNGQVQSLASAIQYAPFGPVTALTFGNGLFFNKGIDQAYRTSSLLLGGLQNDTYQLDPAGNLLEILDNLATDHDRAYGYDALGRVIGFATGEGVMGSGPQLGGIKLFTVPPVFLPSLQTMTNEVNTPPSTTSKPWLVTAVSNLTSDYVNIALDRTEAAPGVVSSAETVGYVAFENGVSGSFIASDGQPVTYESAISSENITGWGTCTNVPLIGSYSTLPLVVATPSTRNGDNGGWLRRCALSTTSVGLSIDEDTYLDAERNHGAEQASLLAFSRAFNAQLTDYDGMPWSLEAGQVTLNNTTVTPAFVTVNFQQAYMTPPVVVVLATNEGVDPSALRIRNLTTNGFELAQVEPANKDGKHGAMTIPYIVIEQGAHRFPDGAWLLAGSADIADVQLGYGVSGTASWHQIDFPFQPAQPGTATPGDIVYSYDQNGNRTQMVDGGTSVTDYAYETASNRMSGLSGVQSASITTDANGNITAIGSRAFIHDTANRILNITDGGVTVATYRYNGLGQRVEKITAQGTTRYVYGTEGQLLGEYQSDGALIREYVYLNGEQLAQLEPLGTANEVLYLHTDHLGAPRLATDAIGTPVWKWESDPFGATAANDDPDGNGTPVTVNLRFP